MSNSIQSSNYRPKLGDGTGGAGWKLNGETGEFEINGVVRVKLSGAASDDKTEPKPFIVVDGVTYIRQSFIDDAVVTKALITQECSARAAADAAISSRVSSIEVSLGQLQSQFVVDADRFSFNDRIASEILHDIRAIIGETSLGQELKKKVAQIDGSVSAAVKEVIRAELKPGGLLHRSI